MRKFDAPRKPGLHPLQRVLAALLKLSYDFASDAVDEYERISESSALEFLAMFCRAVCGMYGVEYGRQPTEEDLRRILKIYANRGFPGCVGSIDCQHWSWEACPIQFVGQFTGKEKKPTIVLEALRDGECWKRHAALFWLRGQSQRLEFLT
jgi:Plant transposon protein